MHIIMQAALVILAAAGVFFVIRAVYGAMLTPVGHDGQGGLIAVIRLWGSCPELEQTVAGLTWLQRTGVLSAQILLVDCGMDEESHEMAALLAKKHETLTICSLSELNSLLAEVV